MATQNDKRFLSLSDLADMPAPSWLVEGLFESNSLVMLAGPSYSFKSFLLLDWLMCMSTDRKWNGKRVAPAKVAYALGEGKSSLLKRASAWANYHGVTPEEKTLMDERFRTTFEVPQMASKASVDNFLADLTKEGFKPDVIAIDTFARAMVGMDENDQKDVGLWVEQADRLRQLGYTVIFLHHTKKNTEFGVQYRGSTAIMGAMDTAMTLQRDSNYCTLTVTKQKDHDEGPDLRFRRVLVDTGGGDESCVLVPAPVLDHRFTEEGIPMLKKTDDIHDIAVTLLGDGSFSTDQSRAEELASKTGISVNAAKARFSRLRNGENG